MKFMKKYKIHVCSRETNANCERTLVTPCQICYNEPIFEVTPHNEGYGALRKFCALTSFRFHGNTASITAKLRIVSTQNLLANHSCSIMRYYLKLRLFRGRSRIGCVLFPFQNCRVSFCAAKHKGGCQRERLFRVERTLQTQSGLGRLNLHVFAG